MSTLFTKIIQGEIPAFKIYEDTWVYAFLDIYPQKPGHTLLVPKIEVDHFSDLPDEYALAMIRASQKISKAITKATDCNRVCSFFIGYEIPHCHQHLIPTNDISEAQFSSTQKADDADLRAMQQKIISCF